jgi:hypothetical protein
MAGTFTLTINTLAPQSGSFGETASSERTEVCYLLHQAIQTIQSGKSSTHLIDRKGNDVGSYSFGAGTINSGA